MKEHQDELEYNDGLGDLLREKERLEFSWGKTIVIFLVLIALSIFILTVIFNLQKSADQDVPVYTEAPISAPLIQPSPELTELKEVEASVTAPQKKKDPAVTQHKKGTYAYKVISGSFKTQAQANAQVKRLAQKNISAFVRSYLDKASNTKRFRVQTGAFETYKEAQAHEQQLNKKGVPSFVVKQ